MNVVIVDTSSWINYFNGTSNPDLDLALKEGRVFLSPIVTAELLSARLKPTERQDLLSFLKELPLCEVTLDHWARVGETRSILQRKGLAVSTPDAHVAQCCLDLDGYLLTEDLIFQKITKHYPLKLL